MGGFRFPQAQPIAAEFEFERVAERRRAKAADLDARRDAHLEQSPADFVGAGDPRHSAHLADRQLGSGPCHADILAATSTEHISPSRKQSLVAPTRTMQGVPGLNHFQRHAVADAELFQPADLLRPTDDLPHFGDLAGKQRRRWESNRA